MEIDQIEKIIQKKYRKQLWTPFIHALKEFNMVEQNDKIAIAISGGKDSLLLAKLFQQLQKISKVKFDLVFISMNPGFSKQNLDNMKKNLDYLQIPCEIYDEKVFEIAYKLNPVKPCYMCARLRRGSLYAKAVSLGCNKLALGHHFDDVIETTLMSMFYMSKVETMLPRIKSDNFDIELIRPLYYVQEKNIIQYTKAIGVNSMNCGCEVTKNLLDSKRREIKNMLYDLSKKDKDIKKRIFHSMTNVNIEKILAFRYKDKKISVYDDFDIELNEKQGKIPNNEKELLI